MRAGFNLSAIRAAAERGLPTPPAAVEQARTALSRDTLTSVTARMALPERITTALIKAAETAGTDEAMIRTIAAIRSRVFSEHEPISEASFSDLPAGHPMVYALALLAGFGFLDSVYRRRTISDDVLRDTMTAFADCLEEYEERHGVLGLGPNSWMLPFFRGRIFQLGRMQFMMEPFPHPVLVYRRKDGTETAILYDGGRTVRADGSVVFRPAGSETAGTVRAVSGGAGSDNRVATAESTTDRATRERATQTPSSASGSRKATFQTGLTFEAGMVAGHRVAPGGITGREPVTLNLDQWELVLAKGFSGLSVHVPAQGKLTPDLVQDAFDRSVSFFARHFPEYPIRAWFITSWLLDPQLQRILSPESNIVRFQRFWYPFPIDNGSDEQFFKDVFPGSPARWDAVPTDTSLQRRMVQHVNDGGAWHEAGGLILPPIGPTRSI